MSLDQFVGEWEIKECIGNHYKLRARMLIGRNGAGDCSLVWLDQNHNLCTLLGLRLQGDRLKGPCPGQAGSGKADAYEVDISFFPDSGATAISGVVKLPLQPPNDDPLTGQWTANRVPEEDGEDAEHRRGEVR